MDGNNETQTTEEFNESTQAQEEALLELIKYLAYMCAKRDWQEFYTKFLESLKLSAEGEGND